MAEALTEGKDINTDSSKKIALVQKQNDWQNEIFKNSLEGIAEVVGTPKVGGNAWVSFEYDSSKVTIHFDEAGVEPSGGRGSGGSSGDIIAAGTESPIEGYSKMDSGNYNISLDSPISGTIKINIIVHSGADGHGTIKDTIELEIHEGHNELSFTNGANNSNSSFCISFLEDINKSDHDEIIDSIVITKAN